MSGLLISAPSSGSGKTVVTLGLMRALRRRDLAVAPGKVGPDYIDPAFHTAACGKTCINFDPHAMRHDLLLTLAAGQRAEGHLVIEAMMGLFDGAANGHGSAADLAALLSLPVVLVIDCARMSQSVAAIAFGFAGLRPEVRVAGVILNKVASPRHEAMLRAALDQSGMTVFGALYKDPALALPERHLGLVQAGEHADIERFINHAADAIERQCDLPALISILERPTPQLSRPVPAGLPVLGQHIAVACDTAFAFVYPHLLKGWQAEGAQLSFFSPLADEPPSMIADAVYLPGGYPELHAGALATKSRFRQGMNDARARGALIYGECGGYMVLGEGLVDADGQRHQMLGLLPLETSFAKTKRHLGYRHLVSLAPDLLPGTFAAHEFHYSTLLREGPAEALFEAKDALGTQLGLFGLRCGRVCGSYMHLIDIAETGA